MIQMLYEIGQENMAWNLLYQSVRMLNSLIQTLTAIYINLGI